MCPVITTCTGSPSAGLETNVPGAQSEGLHHREFFEDPGYPADAENLCHQVIFMNHAAGAVAPLDQEMIQVGHAIWQRAERRGLIQGSCGRWLL